MSDAVAALLAESEFSLIDSPKCCIDSCTTRRASAHSRLCHGLTLKGVHATESANRLLIQHHRATVVG